MPLQLDPRFPLVWRSPNSLQLGIDRPVVTLEGVSNSEERMIAALVAGVTRPGLSMIGLQAGAQEHEVAALLERVSPALRPAPAPLGTPGLVAVSGSGETADRLRAGLGESGFAGLATAEDSPALVIVVAHFVIDPADRGRWLSLDRAHLPIVLGDSGARIGPLVEPGLGPCLHCLELHHRDADPAWPAIASQLWGRRSPLDAAGFAAELAAITLRLIAERLALGPAPSASSLTIEAGSGSRSSLGWLRHPECGCEAPPGSGSAGGYPRAVEQIRTTTGAGAAAIG